MRHQKLEECMSLLMPKNFKLAKGYVEDHPNLYKPKECFNNLTAFALNDNNCMDVTYCYGMVLSGIPHLNGVAVSHGWIEAFGTNTDITMVVDGETEESVKNYLYYPWKKYDYDSYIEALSKDEMPDVFLRTDKEFIEMIESMGYEYIG